MERRAGATSARPVPMKLFAAWEVDRTPSNCIPRRDSAVRICDRKPVIMYEDMSDEMLQDAAVRYATQARIMNTDMSDEMKQDATVCAAQAVMKFKYEKDIAAFIKEEFDKKYHPIWHCIVGRVYGSYFTHETGHLIYFYLGELAILLFKSG